jgi:hypothetical protein
MSNDAESKLPLQPHLDIWTLPAISSVSISRLRYDRPRQHTIDGQLVAFDGGIEIVIETKGVIPIRALAPALHIGTAELSESDQLDTYTHRFFVFDEKALRSGDRIVLGWVGHRAAKPESNFFYEPPSDTPRPR